jgi:Zn-dependent M28 family amino/carboxypeptidase
VETWITEDVARELFQASGHSYDKEKQRAVTDAFRAFPMGLRASLRLQTNTRDISSHNVVGRIEGRDARLKDEHIIYSAHWDHLGIGSVVDGDSIYNGALDNASGVAGVLEIAEAFATRRGDLKRSVLFLLTTAEESGLLGAKQYAEHPLYPLQTAIADINIDGLNVWGRTKDMVVVGFGQSGLDRILEEVCTEMDKYIVPDSEPEKGYYYRSDHFAFAKKGVPSLYADSGVEFIDRPEGWGLERRGEYVSERYHKPQDEYDASWDLSGAIEDMRALFTVGYRLAVSDRHPQWNDTSEFKRIREESLSGGR